MEALAIPKNQSDHKLPNLVQGLSTNLATLQPDQSQTTKIITYALLATAVVGIMVYHYIRDNERVEQSLDTFSSEKGLKDLKERIK